MRSLLPAGIFLALASCGSAGKDNDMAEGVTVPEITLTSDAFHDGQPIPAEFTCDGAGQPPPLAWGEAPAGTRSFALIVDDPDAPGGTFRHWGAYNIPASARSLKPGSFQEAVNDFGKPGSGGPCPPKGHGPHHYRFKLLALDIERLQISNPKIERLEDEAGKHVVARGEFTGTYERK